MFIILYLSFLFQIFKKNLKFIFMFLFFSSMCTLLAKFRIDFSDVIVIPDVTKRAQDATKEELKQILDKLPEG